MKRTRRVLLAALIVGVIAAAVTPLADSLMLFPTTNVLAVHGAQRLLLPFENGQLEVWTKQSRTAQARGRVDAYILRFYGNADRADRWIDYEADAFGAHAVEIWGVNYPGFGESTGPSRLRRLGPAGLAAFDALHERAGSKPILVYGASMGTTVALDVAAHRAVCGIILHNPPPLRQLVLAKHGWWNLWLLAGPAALFRIPHDLDSIANAPLCHAHAVFVLSGNDEVVPPRFAQLVVNSYAGEKRIIPLPGAPHNSIFPQEAVAALEHDYDWLVPAAR
ncbi:MAG: alpha/beta hydrolase [Verrucomicrobiota bacterium]|nr:alpha/beta hydrolase [Verrucomicrobiota bacterium]